jgi:NAD+ synthase
MKEPTLSVLDFDHDDVVDTICATIRQLLRSKLHRRGLLVAISGGIDSAVSAALAVKAIGKGKVYGLLLPERDSASSSLSNGEILARHLGIEYLTFDIAPTLEAIGCYQWRDDAIRTLFPDYSSAWKSKIAIQGGLEGQINTFKLIVEDPGGNRYEKPMPLNAYRTIVAATSYKQRIRKTVEYFHADRLNYAVVGTPNRLEYDQGFFVKNGDGAADLKPIAHLYKTQVYALARHLCLPEVICNAVPSTDTYSLEQGQDEFYFSLPYQQMDVALWCYNNGESPETLASHLGVDASQARLIYRDIERKRKTTRYLHLRPQLVEPVDLGQLAAKD